MKGDKGQLKFPESVYYFSLRLKGAIFGMDPYISLVSLILTASLPVLCSSHHHHDENLLVQRLTMVGGNGADGHYHFWKRKPKHWTLIPRQESIQGYSGGSNFQLQYTKQNIPDQAKLYPVNYELLAPVSDSSSSSGSWEIYQSNVPQIPTEKEASHSIPIHGNIDRAYFIEGSYIDKSKLTVYNGHTSRGRPKTRRHFISVARPQEALVLTGTDGRSRVLDEPQFVPLIGSNSGIMGNLPSQSTINPLTVVNETNTIIRSVDDYTTIARLDKGSPPVPLNGWVTTQNSLVNKLDVENKYDYKPMGRSFYSESEMGPGRNDTEKEVPQYQIPQITAKPDDDAMEKSNKIPDQTIMDNRSLSEVRLASETIRTPTDEELDLYYRMRISNQKADQPKNESSTVSPEFSSVNQMTTNRNLLIKYGRDSDESTGPSSLNGRNITNVQDAVLVNSAKEILDSDLYKLDEKYKDEKYLSSTLANPDLVKKFQDVTERGENVTVKNYNSSPNNMDRLVEATTSAIIDSKRIIKTSTADAKLDAGAVSTTPVPFRSSNSMPPPLNSLPYLVKNSSTEVTTPVSNLPNVQKEQATKMTTSGPPQLFNNVSLDSAFKQSTSRYDASSTPIATGEKANESDSESSEEDSGADSSNGTTNIATEYYNYTEIGLTTDSEGNQVYGSPENPIEYVSLNNGEDSNDTSGETGVSGGSDSKGGTSSTATVTYTWTRFVNGTVAKIPTRRRWIKRWRRKVYKMKKHRSGKMSSSKSRTGHKSSMRRRKKVKQFSSGFINKHQVNTKAHAGGQESGSFRQTGQSFKQHEPQSKKFQVSAGQIVHTGRQIIRG